MSLGCIPIFTTGHNVNYGFSEASILEGLFIGGPEDLFDFYERHREIENDISMQMSYIYEKYFSPRGVLDLTVDLVK